MDLQTLKQQYIAHLELERGRSAKTIENYNRYLERFLTYTRAKTLDTLTAKHIEQFREHLAKQPGTIVGGVIKPMKRKTQNYHLIALRSFLSYITNRGLHTLAPDSITLAPAFISSPKYITNDELVRLKNAPNTKTIIGKRDTAIIALLCTTGLRVSELCALSVADMDINKDIFWVTGRGGKRRDVVFVQSARQAVQTYCKARTDTESALFIRYGRKANDGGDMRLQPRAVQRMLQTYAVQAGIVGTVTPLVIRHTVVRELYYSGSDCKSIQMLLGHTDIAITTKYLRTLGVGTETDEAQM
jgi:site-specific recombinase XerD